MRKTGALSDYIRTLVEEAAAYLMQVSEKSITSEPGATPETSVRAIAANLRNIVHILNQESQYMQRRYGVTAPQALVLSRLAAYGPLSSAELSRLIHVTPANMTGIIDRLEDKGLLRRHPKPGDRRIYVNTLTDKGFSLGCRLSDPIEDALSAVWAGGSLPDVGDINSVLIQLARLLKPVFTTHQK